MVPRILIVGSGITSAATCTYLRQKCQNVCKVVVWDKAKGVGGRMSTTRNTAVETCIADLGAQYITTEPVIIEQNKEVYNTCLERGLLQPLDTTVEGMHSFPEGTKHFVAVEGINSLVKQFLVADDIFFQHHVTKIDLKDRRFRVETKEGHNDMFDVVVLTMPVPQILQLKGHVETLLAEDSTLSANLSSVRYSSRYALCFFYDKPLDLGVPWSAKYISDDDILRYVAIDNKKRNRSDLPTSIVFHTSVKYGIENIERSVTDVQTEIIGRIEKLFPSWPRPQSVKCQKWRFSQATSVYPGSPGCLTLTQNPLLVAGGDGFAKSTFDGCLFSAHTIADVVETYIKNEIIKT